MLKVVVLYDYQKTDIFTSLSESYFSTSDTFGSEDDKLNIAVVFTAYDS